MSSSSLARAMRMGSVSLGGLSSDEVKAPSLPIGFRSMDEALPDAGLPRGAVVEVASPRGLCRSTTVLLSACASAQAEARLRSTSSTGGTSTAGAWCAWLDPSGTLSAGGAAAQGVDLERLLVVRPPWSCFAKVAVRTVESHIFSVVVVDTIATPGLLSYQGRDAGRLDRWPNVVRRLALAVEGSDTTVLLMTDRLAYRSMPWPVAMRIELDRRRDSTGMSTRAQSWRAVTSFRVAKERYGRIGGQIAFAG